MVSLDAFSERLEVLKVQAMQFRALLHKFQPAQ
jgi:hypothetical protein